MAVYKLQRTQRLPISPEEAWQFFSSPANLKEITPPYMGFDITSDKRFLQRMYPGQIITYTVKPLLGIPLFWMTEITHVEEGRYFVDEQRVGPYKIWHHQHHFMPIDGGVEMTDLVHYQIPFGFLGDIAQAILVRRQLEGIFDFRVKKLEEVFGQVPVKA